MGARTGIAWTDHTFNPWWGCTKVSEGCRNCYAEIAAGRWALGKLWGPSGERRMFGEGHWKEPIRWDKRAGKQGIRRRVFCGSMCDVFEDYPGLTTQRLRLFNLIYHTHNLDWLLLTKRPQNISRFGVILCRNLWYGTSAEDQKTAEERIPWILWTERNFLSAEPLLGPIDLSPWIHNLRWVIIGGESQEGCRPMDPEWARDLVLQCLAARVPVFVKQLGGHPDKRDEWVDWPEDLRIQETPNFHLERWSGVKEDGQDTGSPSPVGM